MLSCLLALTWVKTNQPNKNIYPQKNICLHLCVAPRPQPALGLINTAARPSLRCFHVSLLLRTNVTFYRFTSSFAKQAIFYQYMFSNNESFSTVTSKVLLISLQTEIHCRLSAPLTVSFYLKIFRIWPRNILISYHTSTLRDNICTLHSNNSTPLMEEVQCEEVIRCWWKIISASIKYLCLLTCCQLCHVLGPIDKVETGDVRDIRKHDIRRQEILDLTFCPQIPTKVSVSGVGVTGHSDTGLRSLVL